MKSTRTTRQSVARMFCTLRGPFAVTLACVMIAGCGLKLPGSPRAAETPTLDESDVRDTAAEEPDKREHGIRAKQEALPKTERQTKAQDKVVPDKNSERRRAEESLKRSVEESLRRRAKESLSPRELRKLASVRRALNTRGLWIGPDDIRFALGPARPLLKDDLIAAASMTASGYDKLAERLQWTAEQKIRIAGIYENSRLRRWAGIVRHFDNGGKLSDRVIETVRDTPALKHLWEEYLARKRNGTLWLAERLHWTVEQRKQIAATYEYDELRRWERFTRSFDDGFTLSGSVVETMRDTPALKHLWEEYLARKRKDTQ